MLVVVVVYKQRAHHYHHHHHHQTEASCDRQTNQPTKQNKTGQNRNRRQKKAASLWCIHRHTSTNTHYSYCKREEYSVPSSRFSSAQFFDKKYTRTHLPASLGLPSPAGAGAGGKHRPPRRHKHILCLILLFLFRSEMHDEKIGWWFWCWWYFRCWVPCSPTFSPFPSPAAEQGANLASNSGRVNAGYVGSISCWTSAGGSSSSSDVQRRPPDIQISAQTVHRTSTQTQTGKLKPAWV